MLRAGLCAAVVAATRELDDSYSDGEAEYVAGADVPFHQRVIAHRSLRTGARKLTLREIDIVDIPGRPRTPENRARRGTTHTVAGNRRKGAAGVGGKRCTSRGRRISGAQTASPPSATVAARREVLERGAGAVDLHRVARGRPVLGASNGTSLGLPPAMRVLPA
jgi:hypothetical protein